MNTINHFFQKLNHLVSLSLLILVSLSTFGQDTVHASKNVTQEMEQIKALIHEYDEGWDARDLEKVLKGYSQDIDWTNAFGDRTQGKEELRKLLEFIFSLDFVMSGKNNYQDPEFTFLTKDIALVRSTNIRTGQKWPDGSAMNDRVINHLRVYQKIEGQWLCINHMISQAHEKRG